jgi:hypothetical protein
MRVELRETKRIADVAEREGKGDKRTASPLTPALSPLRGEGVTSCVRLNSLAVLRVGATSTCSPRRSDAAEDVMASATPRRAPSPLNGERAGVRGEESRAPSPPARTAASNKLWPRLATLRHQAPRTNRCKRSPIMVA